MEDDFAVMHRLLSEAIACAKANPARAEALRRLAALAITVAVTLEVRR